MEDFRNSFKGSNLLAPLFRRWITFCYGLGDVVITPSEYSRQLLKGYGLRRPVYTLSNGVDTDKFRPDPAMREAFRTRYGLREDEKAVISVGHTIARKGLPEFLELARQMPDVRFFWFGWTDPRLIPAAIRQAMEEAPGNVTFPGFVEPERLREAYCGADVFAFLSHEETEGIVVLEALACGIPVVVRDIPVYRDWLTDGVHVRKARDTDGFRAAVEGILSGTLPDLTAAGRAVAQARSLETVGDRLREIYRAARILPAPPRCRFQPLRRFRRRYLPNDTVFDSPRGQHARAAFLGETVRLCGLLEEVYKTGQGTFCGFLHSGAFTFCRSVIQYPADENDYFRKADMDLWI